MRRLLLLLLLGSLAGLCGGLRVLSTTRTRRSMRSRLGGPFVRCMADGEEGEGNGLFGASGLFGTNRNTPEAMANQREWAREQMALEVPDATVDGASIADREDMIRQYITSEKEKFGRVIDAETAEAEVDEWLLRQATNASAKTSSIDLALAGAVFFLAFGTGLYYAAKAA